MRVFTQNVTVLIYTFNRLYTLRTRTLYEVEVVVVVCLSQIKFLSRVTFEHVKIKSKYQRTRNQGRTARAAAFLYVHLVS